MQLKARPNEEDPRDNTKMRRRIDNAARAADPRCCRPQEMPVSKVGEELHNSKTL